MREASAHARVTASGVADLQRFVFAIYRALLGRDPDAAGLAFWMTQVMNGMPHAEVVDTLLASPECAALRQPPTARLFVPPGHFLSPIVDPAEAERHLAKVEARRTTRELPDLAIDRAALLRTWSELVPLMNSAPFAAQAQPALRYRFDNPSYAWGDGSVLHGMMRRHRPKRVIEIGGGHSSACMVDTVDQFLDGKCQLTFVEPDPQMLLTLIGEAATHVRILQRRVQQVPVEMFRELEADDILFIDSSHVLRTGSDVCFILFEVLPRLASGVLVQFHDMFWPFEYPRAWVIAENRSWNELYAVRAFLANNDAWKVLMFNDYLAVFERPLIEATYPAFLRNSGGALWLQRR